MQTRQTLRHFGAPSPGHPSEKLGTLRQFGMRLKRSPSHRERNLRDAAHLYGLLLVGGCCWLLLVCVTVGLKKTLIP